MERLNFGVRNIYNIVIIGDVEEIVAVANWVREKRGKALEIGYFYIQGRKCQGSTSKLKF